MAEAAWRRRCSELLLVSIYLPVSKKAPIIMTTVSLLSLAAWLELSPPCASLAYKNNLFNSLLVKWSWGWSLLCLVPTVILTTTLSSGLQWKQMLTHLSRLAVAHCIWLTTTSAFIALDSAVGDCSSGSGGSRTECLREKGVWHGFDISGHVFLLTYCVYVLTEEMAGLREGVCYELQRRSMHKLQRASTALALTLELFGAVLMVLWVAMTITTSLYFHTFMEKVLGGAIGFLAWLLTYGFLFSRAGLPPKPLHGHTSRNN